MKGKRWTKWRRETAEELWLHNVPAKDVAYTVNMPIAKVRRFFRELDGGPLATKKPKRKRLAFSLRPGDKFKLKNGHERTVRKTWKIRTMTAGTWWWIDVLCTNYRTYTFRFDEKVWIYD